MTILLTNTPDLHQGIAKQIDEGNCMEELPGKVLKCCVKHVTKGSQYQYYEGWGAKVPSEHYL